ncbi:MAG: YHYH protein [Bryobacterales bacterium]|nr:YHYH protein [Bryobacterales bacterium]
MKPVWILLVAALAVPLAAQESPCPTDVFLDVGRFPGAGDDYPKPRIEVECAEDTLVVRSNGIPHYEFIQITPNPLLETNREYRFPLRPELAETPTPIPLLGTVGVAINGIPFFGPNEGGVPYPGFGDPIYNSIMDACMGHTAREYHYHALVQACLAADIKAGEPSPILAYAADGFAVYGPYGCADKDCSSVVKFKSSWKKLRDPEIDAWDAFRYEPRQEPEYLDRCNGHSGDDHGGVYHYHVTESWPYIVGCFSGTPSPDAGREAAPAVSQGGPRRGPPPPDQPPNAEQVAVAAERLGIDTESLAKALRLTDGRVDPMNFAASARALGVELGALREALALPARRRGPGGPPPARPAAGGEEPPCRFRCGTSDPNAVGCGLTRDYKVVCTRPCDNNKCG